MKRTRSILALFFVILLLTPCISINVSANSAQSMWTGTTSTGAIISDETSPLIVEKELLTFDIQEFPQNYYQTVNDFLSYTGKVTAEYHFYNPADYEITATLVFPFGTLPDYGNFYNSETNEHLLYTDTEKYDIYVNGTQIEKTLRYTFSLYGAEFNLEEDMTKLQTTYIEDVFYSPGLSVTKYTYQANNVDKATYRAATAAFSISADPSKTRVYFANQSGFSIRDDDTLLTADVNLDTPFHVYVIGEPLEDIPEWHFYENGTCEEEIDGVMELIQTEDITFKDLALLKYDDTSGISEYDWYNAIVHY